jgi:hypothetical protein
MGRHDQAIAEAKLAQQADPLSGFAAFSVGGALVFARRWDPAIAASRLTTYFTGAVDGDVVAVGIGDGEAGHAVLGYEGLFEDFGAVGDEVVEGGVHIGAVEVETDVAVGGDAGRIGGGRAAAFVVGSVEHDGAAVSAKHAPVEIVAIATAYDGGVGDEFEAEDLAIEIDGSGHVEHLEKRG